MHPAGLLLPRHGLTRPHQGCWVRCWRRFPRSLPQGHGPPTCSPSGACASFLHRRCVLALQLSPNHLILNVLIYSEPLLSQFPDEIAELSKLTSTPIALGERLYSRFEFRPFFEKKAIDIAQPDVSVSPCMRSSWL